MEPSGYVIGVGAANADICGRSRRPIRLRDSNPGSMVSSAGGVTRNVCENLARLGVSTRLISALGDDVYAELIRRECAEADLDVSLCPVIPNHASSTYISILDDSGDMLAALSDMSVLRELPVSYLWEKAEIIRGARAVICDPCLPEPTLLALLEICKGYVPVCSDPVSTSYARVLAPHVGLLDTVKPNRMELETLSGVPVEDDVSLQNACEVLLKKGLRRVIVTLGKEGCFYMDTSGCTMFRRLRAVEQMANANGGGDAFTAGLLYADLSGLSLPDTLDFALAAGIAAVICPKTVNPDINPSLIHSILKEYRL